MFYYFIVNGRIDKGNIVSDLKRQIEALDTPIEYEIYTSTGRGDATRFVRLTCEFAQRKDLCFVACGGSGTVNEVAYGVIEHPESCMAMLKYGTSNDMTKYYSDRDFTSLKGIINGEKVQIDAIKCNDDYAINVINFGFDSLAAYYANLYIEEGNPHGYKKGVMTAFLTGRFNNISVVVDGEKISGRRTLLCTIANATYCGGMFKCAPNALVDDGLMEVCLVKAISAIGFARFFKPYTNGTHLDNPYCQRHMVYRRARHIELDSKNLIYICLDGEITASTKFVLDILDKAVNLILPR